MKLKTKARDPQGKYTPSAIISIYDLSVLFLIFHKVKIASL